MAHETKNENTVRSVPSSCVHSHHFFSSQRNRRSETVFRAFERFTVYVPEPVFKIIVTAGLFSL